MSIKVKSEVKAIDFLSYKYGLKFEDWSLFYDFESDVYLKKIAGVTTDLSGTALIGVTRNTTGQAQTMARDGTRTIAPINTARKWKIGGRYGLLIEDARSNYFLNSTTPETQTITFPSSSNPIVVSCIGSGSVKITGSNITESGKVVTQDTPSVFFLNDYSSHSITIECAGALSHVQVEIAGGHASVSSPITTATATVSKQKDTVNLNNAYLAESIGSNKTCTIIIQTIPMPLVDVEHVSFENQMSLNSTTTSQIFMALNQRASKGLQKAKLTYAISNAINSDKLSDVAIAQKWGNVTALRLSTNQMTVASGGILTEKATIATGYTPNILYLGFGQASPLSRAGLHGIITKLAIFPRALTDFELKEVTKSWN